MACRNMGVNLKFHVSNNFLCTCLWECGWRVRCTHTMQSLTCVLVVVCVARKPRPCLSYSDGGFAALLLMGAWTIGGRGFAAFAGPMNSDFLPVGYWG